MGIELERMLARLAESGDRGSVTLDEGAALDVLAALSVVNPERVGCDVERLRLVVAG